jgi:dolichol-phosphate mannosyltransferase
VRILSITGFATAGAGFVYAAYVLVARLLNNIPVRGYAPIVIAIALTSGVQMLMLGVLGEYLWRALDEVRRRPPYVIDRVWGPPGAEAASYRPEDGRQLAARSY